MPAPFLLAHHRCSLLSLFDGGDGSTMGMNILGNSHKTTVDEKAVGGKEVVIKM